MAVSKDEILKTISNMSVLEIVDLIEAMEKEFNVSAASAAVAIAAPAGATAAAAQDEQTEFNVIMTAFQADKKVNVIKVVRTLTGLGLKEAKDLVEAAPSTVKEAVSKEEAQRIKKELEEAGGTVEIK